MAKHTVTFVLPERPLGKADAEFSIRKDENKLGTLKISNGSAEWVPANKQYGLWLEWSALASLFEKYGKKGK